MESEARYMRRKVKAGLIEADHEECAIVVHYEVEATVLGELGEPIVAERQDNTKKIKLKTLNENTNIPRLAEEILEKCKLIHASKLSHVEQLLQQLVDGQRKAEKAAVGASARRASKKGEKKAKASEEETPTLANLDRYVEMMYEEVEVATKATAAILQLARAAENLEGLLENEALLGLLARLLQEEGPKSMDLAINIIYILYSFSNFSQFHPVLYQAQVGNMVLKVVELEAKRQRVRELEKERNGDSSDPMEVKREKLMQRKQEKLLYVCFHVLLNLAEEPDIERKMAKRNIVGLLTGMLGRKQNTELLVLALLFLMKLAIFKENLPALRERPPKSEKGALPNVLQALQPYVPHQQEPLLATTLRLLFNLSFDAQLRAAMVSEASGLLPKLASLLKKKQQLPLVLRLLYNLSAEPDARKAIGVTDAPRLVMKQVLACAEAQLPLELAALAINVASDATAAAAMSDSGGSAVRQLVDRLYQSRDPHLIKFMRNLAQHEVASKHLVVFAADLIALAQQVDAPETLVELLGIIGTMPLYRMPELPALAAKYNLIDFLARNLTPGFTDDDVLLEVVIVIGSMAAHVEIAPRFAESRVLTSLYTLITEKQEDDEIVLQILFAFFHLLQAPEPRYALLQQTQLVIYLLDLLVDKCEAVRRMADLCLDVVIETDETWAPQIRQRKFQMHNKEWLSVVDEDEQEEYQDAVALNNAMASLHINQPLDASALDEDGYGYGDEPASPDADYPLGAPYDGIGGGYGGYGGVDAYGEGGGAYGAGGGGAGYGDADLYAYGGRGAAPAVAADYEGGGYGGAEYGGGGDYGVGGDYGGGEYGGGEYGGGEYGGGEYGLSPPGASGGAYEPAGLGANVGGYGGGGYGEGLADYGRAGGSGAYDEGYADETYASSYGAGGYADETYAGGRGVGGVADEGEDSGDYGGGSSYSYGGRDY